MIPLGLSAEQLKTLHSVLAGHHSIYVTAQLLTLDGTRLADLSWRVLDGQVDVDSNAAVTRSCTLSLFDPNRTMSFDTDSPDDGAIYLDRMIQVNYAVRGPGTEQFVIPVFTGPVTKLSRSNDVINVEAQGKEVLAMGAVWATRTYKKGMRKTDLIRSVLAEVAGETKFTLVESTQRMPADYTIGMGNTPWGVARNIANSMGLQLFYDGRGTARLRPLPPSSVFHFRTGDGGTVVKPPQISYSSDELANVIWVEGAVPKGATKPVTGSRAAPSTHPLSPARLGRNGKPRYLLRKVQNSSITSQAAAIELATKELATALLQAVDVSFDAMPIPHLEPMDMARLYTDDFGNAFRVLKFSIPLTTGSSGEGPPMSVGYLKRVSNKPRGVNK